MLGHYICMSLGNTIEGIQYSTYSTQLHLHTLVLYYIELFYWYSTQCSGLLSREPSGRYIVKYIRTQLHCIAHFGEDVQYIYTLGQLTRSCIRASVSKVLKPMQIQLIAEIFSSILLPFSSWRFLPQLVMNMPLLAANKKSLPSWVDGRSMIFFR